jgi:DNA-binding response OmpR family regulator
VTVVLLATDADWIYDEVDAALADDDTKVYRTRTGRQVPAALAAVDPDVVILDLQIGNSGGVASALQMRQEEDMGRSRRRSILMLLDRSADVFMAQMAKADGWLVKPVDSIRLRRACRAVVAGEPYFEGMLEPSS